MKKRIPRIIIAAASSGSGKTTITMGLIRFFVSKGIPVYPFKIGPDYIDPGFHTLCAGRPCYNLDTVLMGETNVIECLVEHSHEEGIAIIEGVMGLYDGKMGTEISGSTAEVAKLTQTPVIVIIDAKAAAQTIGAIALGMKLFDPDCPVAGFILNRIGSERHFNMVKEPVEEATGLPVVGWLPKTSDMLFPKRHLGLVAAWEKHNPEAPDHPVAMADKISSLIKGSFNCEKLIELAEKTAPLEDDTKDVFRYSRKKIRIALAMDNAFHFYYQDNLDVLESLGAQLVTFSPVSCSSLPENICGIYIGGGYPENHAHELEENSSIQEAFCKAVDAGMPVFTECGGFMFLAKAIVINDKAYTMTGIFNIKIRMTQKLSAMGYYTGITSSDSILGPAGLSVSGHIFRWSKLLPDQAHPPSLFKLEKAGRILYDGYQYKNAIGSYLHIHFKGTPEVARNFVDTCRQFQEKNKRERMY